MLHWIGSVLQRRCACYTRLVARVAGEMRVLRWTGSACCMRDISVDWDVFHQFMSHYFQHRLSRFYAKLCTEASIYVKNVLAGLWQRNRDMRLSSY